MELIDSSAWIEYLRRTGSRAHLEVRRLIQEQRSAIVTTEPVVMELLAGATEDRVLRQLEKLITGLRLLPVDPAVDYSDAATIYRTARRSGRTVRKLLDCLIASVAVRTGRDSCAPGPRFRCRGHVPARSAGPLVRLIWARNQVACHHPVNVCGQPAEVGHQPRRCACPGTSSFCFVPDRQAGQTCAWSGGVLGRAVRGRNRLPLHCAVTRWPGGAGSARCVSPSAKDATCQRVMLAPPDGSPRAGTASRCA
ncbi:MAG: PIN domain nuclease [Pseudonocardiaceae bacterium]